MASVGLRQIPVVVDCTAEGPRVVGISGNAPWVDQFVARLAPLVAMHSTFTLWSCLWSCRPPAWTMYVASLNRVRKALDQGRQLIAKRQKLMLFADGPVGARVERGG